MNIIRRNLPNAVTCVNLMAGVAAIVAALGGVEPLTLLSLTLPAWQWACVAMGLGAVADFADGFVARLMRATSPIGAQLDSLSDLVSFGVAPAMLIFTMTAEGGAPAWVSWSSLLIPVCGALRLARFNVSPPDTKTFRGLPIPANALFWVGYAAWGYDMGVVGVSPSVEFIFLVSLAMVGDMRFFTLKFHTWGLRGNICRYALVLCAVALICLFVLEGLMWTVVLYFILSMAIQRRLRKEGADRNK